jgi:hypothetical protein
MTGAPDFGGNLDGRSWLSDRRLLTLTRSASRRISLRHRLADGLVIWIGLIVCTATTLLCSAVLPNLTHAPVCRRTISIISVTVQMDLHLVKKKALVPTQTTGDERRLSGHGSPADGRAAGEG